MVPSVQCTVVILLCLPSLVSTFSIFHPCIGYCLNNNPSVHSSVCTVLHLYSICTVIYLYSHLSVQYSLLSVQSDICTVYYEYNMYCPYSSLSVQFVVFTVILLYSHLSVKLSICTDSKLYR